MVQGVLRVGGGPFLVCVKDDPGVKAYLFGLEGLDCLFQDIAILYIIESHAARIFRDAALPVDQ
ncbi:MAG: hypothetical protein AMJ79_14770 [Phycisphaerae bacterium SM23_30]|nr:MAG: hypothetical protein AMJ79_14770 [Phycisphaerae bacterium SM23_30]